MTNGIQCFLGLALLNKADQRVDNHHTKNNATVDPVTEQQRDQPGAEQHVNQDIIELRQKPF